MLRFLLPKTPYLCTLALTKFLLEFLLFNPSVWADKDAFVLPKLEIEIEIERCLIGKFPRRITTSDRRFGGNECGNCDFMLCFLFLFVILLLLGGCN